MPRADPIALLDATIAGLGGERRDGQNELARAVSDALRDGHHLVAAAPTGSGKSLAYLAPAIASGRRIVVATATIALQTQLITRDLPSVAQFSGVDFSFALLKGRSNYLCRAKLRTAAEPDALFERPVGRNFSSQLDYLTSLAITTTTGDRSTIERPVADAAWAAVSCSSFECPGRAECGFGAECYAELARDRAREVDVLVVNHALYCVHLAAGGTVLPDHDVVILDEAHAFPENATNAFGADLAPDLLVRLAGVLGTAGADADALKALDESAGALGKLVTDREGRIDVGADDALSGALTAVAERLASVTAKLGRASASSNRLDGSTPTDDATKRAVRLATARLEVLRRLAAPGADDVVWVERGRGPDRLRIAPVAVGEPLAAMLLERKPVIAVSATLGGAAPFREFAAAMGFDPRAPLGTWDGGDGGSGLGYAPLQAASSFDWKRQGLLYVGRDLPDPTRDRDAWLRTAGDRLARLVGAAGGRALVLCTSHANVKHFANLLREETDHDVLAQGDADTGHLVRTFLDDETSVLVGTRSFWAGIDAPGVACVLVVIDRIPFPSPGDPLHAARREHAERRGANAFGAVDLPRAALVLGQGTGRLIRRRTDHGVVAVLDPRLATRDYRTTLLAAMPPFRRSVDIDDVCAFLTTAITESSA
ncbi:MAG TPA: ATP-dependent DNA helicase [Acidimicrobiia bacterium]|nr:ATP-dependent DNA helicase [Acidimicrobiia bacterium]